MTVLYSLFRSGCSSRATGEALVITEAIGCYSLLGMDGNPIKCTWNGSDLFLTQLVHLHV